MSRRLTIFLAVSLLVTWTCWGILVLLARARTTVYGQLPFMLLCMLGGLGPTSLCLPSGSSVRRGLASA
jgi:hypothetical protein